MLKVDDTYLIYIPGAQNANVHVAGPMRSNVIVGERFKRFSKVIINH